MLASELRLISLKNSYVQLPELFITSNPQIRSGSFVSIKSVQNDTELYVVWNGQLSPGNYAQLDLTFAQANSLQEELIILDLPKNLNPPECSSCRVELLDSSEYTILSQHSEINLLDSCKLVTNGLVIPIWLSQNVRVLVKVVFMLPNKDFGILTKWTEMQFTHNLQEKPSDDQSNNVEEFVVKDPIAYVSYSLGHGYKPKINPCSILVCGEKGSGKTHYLKSILQNYGCYHCELLNCKQLYGKRPEAVRKRLNELLNDALDKQPSIIALDDIDSIVAKDDKLEDEKGQEAIYKKRLVDVFCFLFKQLERSDRIKSRNLVIISACRSLDILDNRLANSKGRQYFHRIIKINCPSLEQRLNIIRNMISRQKQIQSGISDIELQSIGRKCEFYMPIDLKLIVERAIMNACSRSPLCFESEPLSVELVDFSKALHQYVPSNLRGVALQSKTKRSFNDIGGMTKIKEKLMKTILLPLKYPNLCARCPIQLQNSILLYGPPGCGKTLIAEALTNQEGINSVCVRGPELLSKYIGASEAAVRDLFNRAELARPCVIFFDEFESLVPKRGADSTGVTDRVVNQFLTLMDGVEKMSSDIFIVAASSRPDMIDPAILRPGRLDKHIYCAIPDQKDRFEILRVLSRDIKVDFKSSSLEEWSYKIDKFTGADVQSLLYSAQLKALHSIMNTHGFDKEKSNFEIQVSEQDLLDTFNEMAADIQARYDHLLRNYPPNIRGTIGPVSARATLA